MEDDFLTGSKSNLFPKSLLKITHLEFCPRLTQLLDSLLISWGGGERNNNHIKFNLAHFNLVPDLTLC